MGRTLEEARARDKKYISCFKRYFCLWFLLFLGLVAGFLALLRFVIVPTLSQNTINVAKVKVDGIAIMEPTNKLFKMSMNSSIFADPPVRCLMDPQTFDMHMHDDPSRAIFVRLPIGNLAVEKMMKVNVTGADTQILNHEVYRSFAKQILVKDKLMLAIRSKPTIRIGPMPVEVKFRKNITLKGFNGMKGISLYNPNILPTPMPDGTNMLIDGMIPNFSSFSLQIGDLTTNISAFGMDLGYSVIKDLTLRPGQNWVKVYNHIDPGLINFDLFTSLLSKENVNITLNMNSTVYNGQHVDWLEGPLRETSPYFATLNPKGAGGLKAQEPATNGKVISLRSLRETAGWLPWM
ncbi:hypothetical protein H072_7173 [Dactylellina haptotyla CBS 200.50]|uniref:Uncharacterized protein n=1 Tax=Dactylellina haptotyla (strain CBS 200.50) TaxID=1284197 RepID=S8A873_DACHA|nr:hypothetical protein H072_7173 [Dactylellina haptotyla CBS 200.50]